MQRSVRRDKPTQRKLILQCDTKENETFTKMLIEHADKILGKGRVQQVSMPHFDYRWVIDDENANDPMKMKVFGFGVEFKEAESDLPSSIMDGRWHDQKARIRRNGMKPWNVAYLFNGDCTVSRTRVPNTLALVNAEKNTCLNDGFNIIITPTMTKALTWFIDTHLYLEQVEDDGDWEGTFHNPNYVVGHHKQQKYHGESGMAALMASVRGCSPHIALAIAQKYPAFSDLVNAVGKLTSRNIDPRGILQDVKLNRGKRTRIGYALSERIITFYDMCKFKGEFDTFDAPVKKDTKKRKVSDDSDISESDISESSDDDKEDGKDGDDIEYPDAPDGNFIAAHNKSKWSKKWTQKKQYKKTK